MERRLGPGGGGGGGGGAEQGLQIMSEVVGWEEALCRQQHAAGRGDRGLEGHLDRKSCELGRGERGPIWLFDGVPWLFDGVPRVLSSGGSGEVCPGDDV